MGKRVLVLLAFLLCAAGAGLAQDDDIFLIPYEEEVFEDPEPAEEAAGTVQDDAQDQDAIEDPAADLIPDETMIADDEPEIAEMPAASEPVTAGGAMKGGFGLDIGYYMPLNSAFEASLGFGLLYCYQLSDDTTIDFTINMYNIVNEADPEAESEIFMAHSDYLLYSGSFFYGGGMGVGTADTPVNGINGGSGFIMAEFKAGYMFSDTSKAAFRAFMPLNTTDKTPTAAFTYEFVF